MSRLAIIQFPGSTGLAEIQRLAKAAQLETEVVRWNQVDILPNYDGYILPGGFAFGDYGRAGVIEAHEPVIEVLKVANIAGKPIIGFGNGCQILLETGLLPGLPHEALGGALTDNVRIQGREILGIGFYHDTTSVQYVASAGRSAATLNLATGTVLSAPVADTAGRFMFDINLLLELEQHGQILFKYCTSEGVILNEFPTTPNDSVWGIAGLCNIRGNVVGIMPHPERFDTGEVLFESLREYLAQPLPEADYTIQWQPSANAIEAYAVPKESVNLFVTTPHLQEQSKVMTAMLQDHGFKVSVQCKLFWEVWHSVLPTELEQFTQQLVQTQTMVHTSVDTFTTSYVVPSGHVTVLTRVLNDYEGKLITQQLQQQFKLGNINNILQGVLWEIEFMDPKVNPTEQLTALLQSYLLYNPYAQDCKIIS